ncbi:MAG TPA: DNA polymerase I [Candidatus Krumholzibacteria bacterium]|nr:DNA polymerase I [Candidatus Krumholzibacteria bacterium]
MALYLIDGHALAYRSFFALGGAALRNSKGEETGAIYGFLNTLFSLDQKYHPAHLAVVFDSEGKTFRHEKYEQYKAQRPGMPDGLSMQLPVILHALDIMGIVRLAAPGFEADDVIATLARRWGHDQAVQIVSGDKDLLQLVNDHVHVIRPGKTSVLENELDPAALEAQFGLRADQIIDYLALVGDTSDNVPGVRGIGEKTAAELLARFGSLDAIYQRVDEIEKAGIKKRLVEGREDALHSRDLVRLRDDVPLDVTLEQLARPDYRTPELEQLLVDLEFRRLRDQLYGGRNRNQPEPPRVTAPATRPATSTAVIVPTHYTSVTDEQSLRDLALHLATLAEIAVDTETSGLDPMRAVLAGIAVAVAPGQAYYIPVTSAIQDETPGLLPAARAPGLPLEVVRDALAPVFAAARPQKTGQHIKYDGIVLARAGMPLSGIAFDTMIASYCLDPARRSHGLDALALEVCAHTMIPFEALFDPRARTKDIRRVPLTRVTEYSCEDADYTLRVKEVFASLIEASEVSQLFHDVEMPLSDVLARMEMVGVRVDASFLAALSRGYSDRIGALEESIYREAGERFTLGSTQKLREVLFDKLKLQPSRRTKTGFSTDADVLEGLSGQHPVVSLLLEWRQLTKLKSTYVDALPRLVHPETGRVHTSYNQAVATTGRLSSSEPNLQNIPIRTAEGREIRRAFVARGEDWVLLDADYSQIELRILAHLSGDEGLVRAFLDDADVHRRTAAKVMGVAEDAVSGEMRDRAKVVNFGIVYGMGARGLAQALDIETDEARRFIEDYFRSYPGVKRFIDATIAAARRDRSVATLLGRMRRLPDIDSSNPGARAFSERIAVNTPVQGTAADIMKIAMVAADREITRRGLATRMILTVHDELLFDVPKNELAEATELVRSCMEGAMKLSVPLKVETGMGANWLDAH